jgi:hypothetical protein
LDSTTNAPTTTARPTLAEAIRRVRAAEKAGRKPAEYYLRRIAEEDAKTKKVEAKKTNPSGRSSRKVFADGTRGAVGVGQGLSRLSRLDAAKRAQSQGKATA